MTTYTASLITGDGQIQFGGVMLGDDSTSFCEEITGWDDLPDLDYSVQDQAMYYGCRMSATYARGRTITWSGKLNTTTRIDFPTLVKSVRAALTINSTETQIPIYIRTHDETLVCFGSCVKRAISNDRAFGAARIADVAAQFYCPDPRRYSLADRELSAAFPSAVGTGLTYPLSYPLDYGDIVTTGHVVFTNDGDAALPAVFVVTGPCVTPTVVNNTAASRVAFDMTLTAGETLTLDTAAGTALLNGVTDVMYTRVASSSPMLLLELLPGANDVGVTASSWSDGAGLTITAQQAAYL